MLEFLGDALVEPNKEPAEQPYACLKYHTIISTTFSDLWPLIIHHRQFYPVIFRRV